MAADGSIVFSFEADDKDAQKKLTQLQRDIQKTANAVNTSTEKHNGLVDQLNQAREAADATRQKIEELRNEQAKLNEKGFSNAPGTAENEQIMNSVAANEEQLSQQTNLLKEQEKTVQNLEKQEQKSLATLEEKTAQLEAQKNEAGALEAALASQGSNVLPQIKQAVEAASQSFKSGFKNILKWGLGIRSIFVLVRRLRSAIKEGLQAFALKDPETKASLDGLKMSLTTLKASWGAAFAPIVNAVAPLLQKLIGWLTSAANAIQMFFAMLNGKTSYKKVIANNNALAKSYGGAGGAAKEAARQLLAFDEINKLNEESSGGGGSGAGINVQEEELSPWVQKLKKWLDEVGISMEDVKKLALGVAGALGLWVISPFLKSLSGATPVFLKVLGLVTAIYSAVDLVKTTLNAWKDGVDWKTIQKMLLDTAGLAIGLGLAFGPTALAAGLLAGGIAMIVVSAKDWIKAGKLSKEAFLGLAVGIAAVSIALGLMWNPWALMIGAIAVGGLAIEAFWDEMPEKIKGVVTEIEIILGAAAIAVGAILAFSGVAIPLGIALMAAGMAMEAQAFINFDKLPDTIKEALNEISIAVGLSLLAIGAIIALSGAGFALGIGMMMAGAVVTAVATLNWSKMPDQIKRTVSTILGIVGGALLVLGAIFTFTGANPAVGIGLMIAGAASLASAAIIDTEGFVNMVRGVVGTILAILGGALIVLGVLLCLSGAGIGLGLAVIAAGLGSTYAAWTLSDNPIVTFVKNIANAVIGYINAVIEGLNELFHFHSEGWSIKGHEIVPSFDVQLVTIPTIPLMAARGGIIDRATPFIAGEAGKEAVIPLERNTEWIGMVAQGLVDRLLASRQLADYITGLPMPALASGQVVPPQALSGSGSILSDSDIDRLVNSISAVFSGIGGGNSENVTKLYLDGREIAQAVTRHQRRMDKERGA